MAVLGATSLTGCNSIPSFIAAGTKMIFNNATSPTSWTKDTTVNEGMLRIINGLSLSPGGTTPFSQVFIDSKPVSVQLNQNSVSFTVSQVSAFPTTVTANAANSPSSGPATVSTAQFTSHNHPYVVGSSGTRQAGTAGYCAQTVAPANTGASGQNQGHAHAMQPHGHQWSTAAPRPLHDHSISGQHSHSISSTENFDILYVDMIVSTKD